MNCYWCGQPIKGIDYITHKINGFDEIFHFHCYGNKLQGAEKP